MGLLSWLKRQVPEDPEPGCGWFVFKLSSDHPFTPGCDIHDWEYKQSAAGKPDKPLDQVDWDLFWRWTLIAKSEPDLAKRNELAFQICQLWPLARAGGNILWDGDPVVVKKPV